MPLKSILTSIRDFLRGGFEQNNEAIKNMSLAMNQIVDTNRYLSEEMDKLREENKSLKRTIAKLTKKIELLSQENKHLREAIDRMEKQICSVLDCNKKKK